MPRFRYTSTRFDAYFLSPSRRRSCHLGSRHHERQWTRDSLVAIRPTLCKLVILIRLISKSTTTIKSPQVRFALAISLFVRIFAHIFSRYFTIFLGLSTTKFDPIAREFQLIARIFGKINCARCTWGDLRLARYHRWFPPVSQDSCPFRNRLKPTGMLRNRADRHSRARACPWFWQGNVQSAARGVTWRTPWIG